MSTPDQARQALAFEPPAKQAAGDYALAEKECFKATGRYLQRLRELQREKREAEERSQRLWDEKEALGSKLNRYLVRNLIPLVDNCKAALGGRPGALAALRDASLPIDEAPAEEPAEIATGVPEAVAAPAEEPAPAAETMEATPASPATQAAPEGEAELQARYLESALRNVLSLLTSLDLYRVELLGRTTEDVVVQGEPIENPFEIEEAQGKGKISELRVREVIDDLWVRSKNGVIEVVRKGRVKC